MRDLEAELEETAGIVIAHTALLTSLFGVLHNRGVIDQKTVNEVVDLALLGVENAHRAPGGGHPSHRKVYRRARKVLEEMAGQMGGRVSR